MHLQRTCAVHGCNCGVVSPSTHRQLCSSPPLLTLDRCPCSPLVHALSSPMLSPRPCSLPAHAYCSQLFDVRAYDKGPFFTFAPDLGEQFAISGLKFSNDGKLMLVSTTKGTHALLDAFKGVWSPPMEPPPHGAPPLDAPLLTTKGTHALLDAFKGGLLGCFTVEHTGAPTGTPTGAPTGAPTGTHTGAPTGVTLDACFSGSADYVLAGAGDGTIWHWSTSGVGQAAPTLPNAHCAAVRALKCNPTRMMVASACANGFITLFLPRL